MELYNEVIANGGIVCYNSLSKKISSFKSGGGIDVLVRPISVDMLIYALNETRAAGERYTVIGQASNILFDDNGYRGTVILSRDVKGNAVEGNLIRLACGESLSAAAKTAKSAGLSGFEKLAGIPGTIGGAVVMNAGCFGVDISDIFEYADIYCDGEIKRYNKSDMRFGYRNSVLRDYGNAFVVEAAFRLTNAKKADIAEVMQSVASSRRAKQPNEPSLGSVFKNPEGLSVAKIIEECGLKGAVCGGAQVSPKHANFIVNTGNATSADYRNLCDVIKQSVRDLRGIELVREVIFLTEDGQKY